MRPRSFLPGTTNVLALMIALLSACSANSAKPALTGPSTGTGNGSAPVSAPTDAGTAGTDATPDAEPTFSPSSVWVVAHEVNGDQVRLQVIAPVHTRFQLGRDLSTALPCRATGESLRGPVSYFVVCPKAPDGSALMATISYGDFKYTFMKALN